MTNPIRTLILLLVVRSTAAEAALPALGDARPDHAAVSTAVALFAGMLALLELGRRLGLRRLARDTEGARAGMGAVDGAVFALLGLLLAFTFSGAASRFDQRRNLIVEEANCIGTAWLRLDTLPAGAQVALRDRFRQYVDTHLAAYRKLAGPEAARAELAVSMRLQDEIWALAVAATGTPEGGRATMLLLPALNDMFDIVTTRTVALETHPPKVIYGLLAVLALASSLLAGFGMSGSKRRSWVHILGFAAIVATSVYVIRDLEHPRMGLIRIDPVDRLLMDLRVSMGP